MPAMQVRSWSTSMPHPAIVFVCLTLFSASPSIVGHAGAANAPTPFLEKGRPVDWWFVHRFNSSFAVCGTNATRQYLFADKLQPGALGQQFVFASRENPALQIGSGCAGATTTDPLGVTCDEIHNGPFYRSFGTTGFTAIRMSLTRTATRRIDDLTSPIDGDTAPTRATKK